MTISRRIALVVLVLLALAGVADGVHLTKIHVEYDVNQTYASGACHQLSATGCDIAVKSPWSEVAGVPVAFVGVAADAGIALVGILALTGRGAVALPLLFSLGIGGVLVSCLMLAVSIAAGSFCPFCMMWYGINAGLLVAAWVALDRPARRAIPDLLGALRQPLRDLAFPALAVGVAGAFGTGHVVFKSLRAELEAEQKKGVAQLTSQIAASKPVALFEAPDAPVKGPAGARFVIVEFSDFQCPYCRKLWETLEAVVAEHGDDVRISFVHFPLDNSCNPLVSSQMHPNACRAAFAGECARRQGKFWQLADIMFHNQGALGADDLLGYAAQLGMDVDAFSACVASDDVRQRIQADIALGAKMAIGSTPTFFINGYKAEGALPKPYVDDLMRELPPAH